MIGDVLARASVEDLIEWRRAVLTDVPRLGREDDERVTIGRENHIGISMHDLESRHVADGTLEPAVFVAGDDERVEPVLPHRYTHVRVAPLELCS